MKIVGAHQAWPTAIMAVTPEDAEKHNEEIVRVMLDRPIPENHLEEVRVPNLELLGNASVNWLVEQAKVAAQMYVGSNKEVKVSARGVVLRKGCHLRTHTERDESDLAIAYWPTGDYGPDKPVFSTADGFVAPTFCIEDPSRGFCDYRLPFERSFSLHVAPRAGLMAVFPAHVPHNMFVYMGDKPFIHIVFQVRFQE